MARLSKAQVELARATSALKMAMADFNRASVNIEKNPKSRLSVVLGVIDSMEQQKRDWDIQENDGFSITYSSGAQWAPSLEPPTVIAYLSTAFGAQPKDLKTPNLRALGSFIAQLAFCNRKKLPNVRLVDYGA